MRHRKQNRKIKTTQGSYLSTPVTLRQLEEQCKRLPNNPKVWKGLAVWHLQVNDFEKAYHAAEKAYNLSESDTSIAAIYGAVLYNNHEITKAVEVLEKAFKTDPSNLQVCSDLGLMHYRRNDYVRCQSVSEIALEYHPENIRLLQLKASALKALHKLEDAYIEFKQLTIIDAMNFRHWIDIGNIERDLGELDKSLKSYQTAMALNGNDGSAYSNYVTTVHYHPAMSRNEILDVCNQWQQKYAPIQIDKKHNHLEKVPTKKLRIGLLSDGFKRSPVGRMITSVIEAFDKNKGEFIAFSTNDASDDLTDRIRSCCTQWHFVAQVLEDKLFKLIQDEKIDILIDLAGHNNGSRMSTIAKKPAPIIIKWVGGLINTTAVDAIDYLISDWIETPEGVDEYYTEKLIRMPNDYICYDPPHYAPPVNSLPAIKNGFITFGCFNNPTKINNELLQNWAAIMKQLPNSRLFLKSFQFTSSALCERITRTLLEFDIAPDRLRIEGPSPHADLLDAYNDVDIALDTWPYSGGLTTCEAMLMGVPVVTLPGPTFAGRHSATHLINAGMPELVVDSWEMYQYRALELASDLNSLSTIREHLRLVLLQSPVCDAKQFATHLNDAIRSIWIRYCEGLKPTALNFTESGKVCFSDSTTLGKQSKEIINQNLTDDSDNIDDQPDDIKNEKIITLDHGGILLKKSTTQEMLDSGALELIVFDPPSNHLKNPLRNHPNVHYYPNIALGDGNPTSLYACQSAELTGTLKPAPNEYMPKQLQDDLQVLAELPIGTVTPFQVQDLHPTEILILDNLSDNLTILKSYSDKIKELLILKIRVNFQKTHDNQSTFFDISQWAQKNEFRLFGFGSNEKNDIQSNILDKSFFYEDLYDVDAIFVPTNSRIDKLNYNTRNRLSYLANNFFNLKGFSFGISKKMPDTTLLFFPDYSHANPYQKLLYSIFPKNINIKPGLPWSQEGKTTNKNIFHIHWEDAVYRQATTPEIAKTISIIFIDLINQIKHSNWKIIWTIHNDAPHENIYPDANLYLQNKLSDLADVVLIHSETAKNMQIKKLPILAEKIIVLPNGSYEGYYKFDILKEQAREKLNININTKVFLSFGLIREYKGLDNILKAFSSPEIQNQDCILIIAGTGHIEELIKKYYKGAIEKLKIYNNYIDDNDVQIFFSCADYSIFGFKKILNSSSVILSHAFKTPVIIPEISGLDDFFGEDNGTITYKNIGINGLKRAIKNCIEMDQSKYTLLTENSSLFSKKYAWEKFSDIVKNVLDTTINNSKKITEKSSNSSLSILVFGKENKDILEWIENHKSRNIHNHELVFAIGEEANLLAIQKEMGEENFQISPFTDDNAIVRIKQTLHIVSNKHVLMCASDDVILEIPTFFDKHDFNIPQGVSGYRGETIFENTDKSCFYAHSNKLNTTSNSKNQRLIDFWTFPYPMDNSIFYSIMKVDQIIETIDKLGESAFDAWDWAFMSMILTSGKLENSSLIIKRMKTPSKLYSKKYVDTHKIENLDDFENPLEKTKKALSKLIEKDVYMTIEPLINKWMKIKQQEVINELSNKL